MRCRLVGTARLLGLQGNASLVVGLNGDRLVVHEPSMFSGVLVDEVEGVSGELYASAGCALDEEGIVVS